MNDEAKGTELGRLIRRQRQASGLSLTELAERCRVDRSTLFRLERGEIQSPDPNKLQRIAMALDAEVEEYFSAADYYSAVGLPGMRHYLRTKYGVSNGVADDVEKFLQFRQQQENDMADN